MRLIAPWIAFLAVHLVVAWLGWVYPSQPMGDVVLVYEPWSSAALSGGPIVGVSDAWVYPQLALVPMLITGVLAVPLAPLFGLSAAYLIVWAVLVTALDAIAFAVLLGRATSSARRSAAWFWCAALLLLGPIALYRIDAITVPMAVIGGLWIARRPIAAAALLTAAAWIKIWPAALVAAAVLAARARLRILLTAAAVSVSIIVLLLLLGGGEHVFGFLTAQTGRGLQVEAVAATPFLWLAMTGAASIVYSHEILTFQIEAPGASTVASLLTVAMVLVVAATAVIGGVQALRRASFSRLLPPLALALVVALIVTNKVGSPQFQVWLIAPAVLWIVLDRARAALPVAMVLVLCALTCLVYPLMYDALLRAEALPVVLLSLRNGLLVALLVISIRAVLRVPTSVSRSRHPSLS